VLDDLTVAERDEATRLLTRLGRSAERATATP
jgi:hypothetical protein